MIGSTPKKGKLALGGNFPDGFPEFLLAPKLGRFFGFPFLTGKPCPGPGKIPCEKNEC